jgi:hypothetical protein
MTTRYIMSNDHYAVISHFLLYAKRHKRGLAASDDDVNEGQEEEGVCNNLSTSEYGAGCYRRSPHKEKSVRQSGNTLSYTHRTGNEPSGNHKK